VTDTDDLPLVDLGVPANAGPNACARASRETHTLGPITPIEFFTAQFGGAVSDEREIVITCERKSWWHRDCESAAACALTLNADSDVYFGVALQNRAEALAEKQRRLAEKAKRDGRKEWRARLSSTRGFELTAQVLGAISADLDIAGPGHDKKGLPTSREQVTECLSNLPHKATYVFWTGGGFQAWWLYTQPWILDSESARITAKARNRGWLALIAKTGGFTVDPTHDIARVMRVPGLTNRKRGVPIEVIERNDTRYAPLDFKAWDASLVPLAAGTVQTSARPTDAGGQLFNLKLQALLEFDPKFAATWTRQRPEFQSQSEHDMSLAAIAVRAEWSDDEITALILEHRRLGGPTLVEAVAGRQDYFNSTIGKARAGASTPGAGPSPAPRPQVLLRGGSLHAAADAAEEIVLRRSEPDLFQRAGMLVHVVRHDGKDSSGGVRLDVGAAVIRRLQTPTLAQALNREIAFARLDSQGRASLVDCPDRLATWLLERGKWSLPPLAGVREAPTMVRDGRIVEREGYDPASGLLLTFGGVVFPPVPLEPTKDDAARALARIKDLIGKFPFENDVARAVALAATFTPLSRPAFRTAPGFGFSAPVMSSGKGLLAYVPAALATGHGAAAMPQGARPEEENKRVLALLLSGSPIALVDNIERPLRSDGISTCLTEDEFADRLLGKSEMVHAPTGATTWFFTGNGLVLEGDLRTRILVCPLDPRHERPWERAFAVDLRKYVPAHRGELVADVLTILRAYHVAGRPKQGLIPFGRFEEWSDLVRGALVWLGEEDPVQAIRANEARDPETELLTDLQEAWSTAFGTAAVTAADCIEQACAPSRLRDVLKAVATGRDGALSARALGTYLARFDRRIHDGRRFERGGAHARVVRWRLVTVDSPSGGGGGGGGWGVCGCRCVGVGVSVCRCRCRRVGVGVSLCRCVGVPVQRGSGTGLRPGAARKSKSQPSSAWVTCSA
jgi:hypothetical protein